MTEAGLDQDEWICGESYDHDLVTDYEGPDGIQATCRRCGAEVWTDADDENS